MIFKTRDSQKPHDFQKHGIPKNTQFLKIRNFQKHVTFKNT